MEAFPEATDRGQVDVVRAPGRVNLIGEHTDYNQGLVLPVAIDLEIRVARRRRPDRRVRLASLASGEVAELDLDRIGPRTGGWIDYVAGTAREMAAAGLAIGGFDGVIGGTIPVASGLSSSAALELAAAWSLSGPAGPLADALTIARIAQRAENTYVGVMCGLMDQFASASGVAGAAVLLDCRSLHHRPVPLPAGLILVVAHTGMPRTLGTSEYNARRADCERAAAALAAVEPGVRSLRDVDRTMLERHAGRLDPVARRRAEHVVDENLRVLATEAALRTGDLVALGRLFAASHASLRDRFEVSSAELDTLVEIAVGVPGVVASRMTGAGFGGCTVSLARPDAVDELRARILADYPRRTGRTPSVWVVEAVDGAGFLPRGGSLAADAAVAQTGTAAAGRSGDRADLLTQPHRRHNPLTDEWILVSTDRIQRPLQGRSGGSRRPVPRAAYDPGCYLCPGNVRASGEWNPAYRETFVFTNDYAALRPDTSDDRLEIGLLRAEGERGTCRVICFSPRHDLDMARIPPAAVRSIVDLWADQTTELGASFRWVQVFENRGEAMGATNPHPHGQIWAGSALPVQATREDATQRRHFETTGRRLLLDYVDQEHARSRVVVENDEWLIVVPFWAAWPFETLVVAKRPTARIADLTPTARDALAVALIELLSRYDNLFRHPFPYSMGWHQAPFDGGSNEHWQLHAHLLPPLLRSATVRKFMVGYELLAEVQRDLTAEEAAARLRAVPPVHYLGHETDGDG
jgi:UDPglucose--hexose-1-phosphate uridylyltransferase